MSDLKCSTYQENVHETKYNIVLDYCSKHCSDWRGKKDNFLFPDLLKKLKKNVPVLTEKCVKCVYMRFCVFEK